MGTFIQKHRSNETSNNDFSTNGKDVQELDQAKQVIQTYRQSKVSRKVHKLDQDVKINFWK